ncbi:hypothetical protein SJA_C1-02130 [Sphingobium indicum UT26S]|uniref:Uncharacterized protein n=1 Tax=Sphingobium indicum (strain DSM 16413 / CCM 7287 / MTCC 6362 / UT26 / NBRC 101211 / UT26S) TaxID=452662 RepID=D4YXG5_SPHIU|nr:hypothetical protein SJA_C1-02130 [Sphingobium indicum UT26S]
MMDHSAATRNPHASRRAARDQRHDLQPAAPGRHEDMLASRTYNAAHIGGCRSGGGEHRSRDGGAGAKRKNISPAQASNPWNTPEPHGQIRNIGEWPMASVNSSLRAAWGGGPPLKAVVEGKIGRSCPFPSTSLRPAPSPSPDGED